MSKIKERITMLTNAINKETDTHRDSDLETVEDFINDCGAYVDKVTAMESALAIARFRMEPEDYRELIIRLDRNRKYAHDALIASVRVINRLCKNYGVSQVYTGPDERIPIADFALEVTAEYFKERRL